MQDLSNIRTDILKEFQDLKQEVAFFREKEDLNRSQIASLKRKLLSFELAANGANAGIWDWDLVNEEVFISNPWLKMLGYDHSDFSTILDFWAAKLHPEDKKTAIKTINECLTGRREEFKLVFRMQHKDGSLSMA